MASDATPSTVTPARMPLWAWLALLVLPPLLWLLAAGRSHDVTPATSTVVLKADTTTLAVWPAVTVLADPSRHMDAPEALAARDRFSVPATASGTLGLQRQPVWLRVPFSLAADAPSDWVFDVDYPALNRLDVHLVTGGTAVLLGRMGSYQPFSHRAMASRTHALPLTLQPGQHYELLLRVETQGGTILPITLNRPAAFHARAVSEQMLQGTMLGIGFCLLVYSLAQWFTLREPLFAKYALLVFGSSLFSVFTFGIGTQFFWSDSLWAEQHVGGLAALLATTGSFLFIEQALADSTTGRLWGRVMKIGAAITLAIAVVYVLDVVETRFVTILISLIGPLPALLGLPGSLRLARRGDRIGVCFLLAWLCYFATTAVLIGVINGRVGVTFWTLHSFEIGTTIDMLLFMRVLGLRLKAVHTAALIANHEREALRSLALTDSLTGLPNRRRLDDALATALKQATSSSQLAIFVLDLDGFKPVNDRYGHDVGDEVLQVVARRLKGATRHSDVVARTGGDEFVVMTAGLHHAQQAADIGQQLLDAFRAPFVLSQHSCTLGLTVGYAIAPIDGTDAAALLKRADAAMYAGKQAGKNQLRRSADAGSAG